MARRYNVSFENVSVSAAQDLISVFGATGKMCRIIEVSVADIDTTAPTNTALALRCRFLPATVTQGSGGTTPTPQKFDAGDAAASFTAHANDTTKSSTGGTAVVQREDGANVFGGYTYQFPNPPCVGPSEAFVFELISTPVAALKLSGNVVVEEIGG